MNAAMADGSVRFIRSSIAPHQLAAAITIDGREPVDLSIAVRLKALTTVLRWPAVVLILRVLIAIRPNFPDYFSPNFDSLFLQGRETTFVGAYRPAFYIHIFSGPVVLLNGLILLSDYARRHFGGLHRFLGRIQAAVLLLLVLPSSVVMARHAFGGWPARGQFSGPVSGDRNLCDRRRRLCPPPIRSTPSMDAPLLCFALFGSIAAIDFRCSRAS